MTLKLRHARLASFLLWAFLLSWGPWIIAIGSGTSISQPGAFFPYVLGGFGPSLAAALLIMREPELETRRDFRDGLFAARGISLAGWLIIAFLPAIMMGVGIGLDQLLGGAPPAFDLLEAVRRQPFLLVSTFSLNFLLGPVSEEMGWRGVALPLLEDRHGKIVGNLLLAAVVALWHMPLFYLPGTVQAGWGVGGVHFWLYLAGFIPTTFIYAWLIDECEDSLFAAILFHFSMNIAFSFTGTLSLRAEMARILFSLLAAGLLWMGPRREAKQELPVER